MIVGPYNFDDDAQLDRFIEDIKAEMPENDHRTRLLDELKRHVGDTTEQSRQFEETIDRWRGEKTPAIVDELNSISRDARRIVKKIEDIKEGK